jgi:hypothetical protein
MVAVGKVQGWPAFIVCVLLMSVLSWLKWRSDESQPAMKKGDFSAAAQVVLAAAPEPLRTSSHDLCREYAQRPTLVCHIDDRLAKDVLGWVKHFERAGWVKANTAVQGAQAELDRKAGSASIARWKKRQEVVVTLRPRGT